MRVSQLLLPTLREAPADVEIASHQLMLRAGLVRQQAAGIYSWLPLGLRILRRVEAVVREEMEAAGAQEVLMPGVQPAELWHESGRWEKYGPELLRIQDRHNRDFCLGPTHEEIIVDLMRREIRSYKQLPANFFQIQTKFRDEIRPRFGVMRAREFIMKDAYSFHLTEASLAETYQVMYDAYGRVFSRLGLEHRAVQADSGSIGGAVSHEFHVLADAGEDLIAFAADSDYAANVELVPVAAPTGERPEAAAPMVSQPTPGVHTIEEVCASLGVKPDQTLKTLVVESDDENSPLIALVVRGDHALNEVKAQKLPGVAEPIRFADESAVRKALGVGFGSLGPVGLSIPIFADQATRVLADFTCGANKDGEHLTGVNWDRDLPEPEFVDLRQVEAGDPSPDGAGSLSIRRGIEVGHVFQLGTKYSKAMKAACLDESGQSVTLTMGCYGIGISRIVAAAIEQHHDDAGITWPDAMAPFDVALVPIAMHRSERLKRAVAEAHDALAAAGYRVLLDDRKERPGVMFADMELFGIPHRLVMSDRGLDADTLEYKHRRSGEEAELPLSELVDAVRARTGPG